MRVPSLEDLAVLRAIHEGLAPASYLGGRADPSPQVRRLLADRLVEVSEDDPQMLVTTSLGAVIHDHLDLGRLPDRKYRRHVGMRHWTNAGLMRTALTQPGDIVRIIADAARDPMRPFHGLVAEVLPFASRSADEIPIAFDNPATGRRKSVFHSIDGIDLLEGHVFEMARQVDPPADLDPSVQSLMPAF